jgi:hypothetical protein
MLFLCCSGRTLAAVQVQQLVDENPHRTINWKRANNLAGLILSMLVSTCLTACLQAVYSQHTK